MFKCMGNTYLLHSIAVLPADNIRYQFGDSSPLYSLLFCVRCSINRNTNDEGNFILRKIMTKEQYNILKQFEERELPVFTNAINGKNTGPLSSMDIKILNEVARTTIKEKYSSCSACIASRRRFIKNLAKAYFEYKERLECE